MKKQTTTFTTYSKHLEKKWLLYDAANQILGRFASEIANKLQGKHKVNYSPSEDNGDFVIVCNAKKVVLSAKKESKKMYYSHSRYPGGLKSISFQDFLKKNPEDLLRLAVQRMLPKNRLGRKMLTHLKVFAGETHNLEAQKPVSMTVNYLKEKS